MLRAPSQSVKIPVLGLTEWEQEAGRLGKGIQTLMEAGTELAREKQQVDEVAQQAQLAARMQEVCSETRDELADSTVKDWHYAWQKASAPKVAEVLEELPVEQRDVGRRAAALYNARSALETQRDVELEHIEKSRRAWQQQLDQAIARGDDEQAQKWLNLGNRVFVPESDMEAQQASVLSRSCLSRWTRRLAAQPMEGLAALQAAPSDQLPTQEDDSRHLRELEHETHRRTRRELAGELARCVEQGRSPEPRLLESAYRANLLTEGQYHAAGQQPEVLSPQRMSEWLRLIDERHDDEEYRTGLIVDITTAPMPLSDRAALLKRLRESDAADVADRRAMSHGLFDLYMRGGLGCPEDEMARTRYLSLQREALPILLQGGADAAAQWLDQQREIADCWVCFDPELA